MKHFLHYCSTLILIGITVPVYFLIFSISLNFFDTADETSWQPWIIVGVVFLISIAVIGGSLYGGIRAIKGRAYWRSIGISLIPMAVLTAFWVWLMQQSFT